MFRSFCPHRQFCLSPPGSSLVALVRSIRLISPLSCLLSGTLLLVRLSLIFLFLTFFKDFSFVSSVLFFLVLFFFVFFSWFLFTFCSVCFFVVCYRCCRYRLSRVSDFLPGFPIVFFYCFFFKSFHRFGFCPISLVTPLFLPSCNLLLQFFLCNFPRFF